MPPSKAPTDLQQDIRTMGRSSERIRKLKVSDQRAHFLEVGYDRKLDSVTDVDLFVESFVSPDGESLLDSRSTVAYSGKYLDQHQEHFTGKIALARGALSILEGQTRRVFPGFPAESGLKRSLATDVNGLEPKVDEYPSKKRRLD